MAVNQVPGVIQPMGGKPAQPYEMYGGGPQVNLSVPVSRSDDRNAMVAANNGAAGIPQVNMQSAGPAGGAGGIPQGADGNGAGVPGMGTPVPATGTSTFGAGNNLISSQFGPGASAATQHADTLAGNAANTYAGATQKPFQSISGPDTTGVQNSYSGANNLAQSMSALPYQAVAGTDQSGTRSYMQGAGQYLNGGTLQSLTGAGQTGSFGYGGDTGAVRGQVQSQLNQALNSTPDRGALAKSNFDLLQESYAPKFEQELRGVGQRAAALGRVGAGLTTSDLGDVAQRKNEFFGQQARGLANDAAAQTLNDAGQRVGLAQGVLGQFGGLDQGAGSLNLGYQNSNNAERGAAFDRGLGLSNALFGRNTQLAGLENDLARQKRGDAVSERDAMNAANQYGNDILGQKSTAMSRYGDQQNRLGSDAYDRSVGERNASNAYDQQGFNNQRSQFGDLAGYANDLYGRDVQGRNELRGERAYQYGLSRDAQGDAIAQNQQQEGQYNTGFNQGMDLWGAGNNYDPTGAYQNAAGQAQGNANSANGNAADLFSQWAQQQALNRQDNPQELANKIRRVNIPQVDVGIQ